MTEEIPVPNKGEVQALKNDIKVLDKTAELRASIQAKAATNLAQAKPIITPSKILTSEEISANALSIPSLLDTEDSEYEHACVYGDAGMGKTLAICLLSEFYHILFLDGDKGLKTAIRTLPSEMQSRIHPIRIPDNTSNPVFWNSILKIITGRQVTLCVHHGIIDCPICKQSNGQLVTIALNQLGKNWVVGMDSITQFVTSASAAINRKATGASGIKDTNDEFKFTFVSHTLLTKTEDEKAQKIVPIGGTENASRSFAKYFSTVVNCKIVNNKHTYVTSSTYNAQVTTKSRSNVKLELAKIPSLLHLFRADAEVLLKGSWNEWFFGDQKGIQPKPKGVLPE
jgi:hypothetical protein